MKNRNTEKKTKRFLSAALVLVMTLSLMAGALPVIDPAYAATEFCRQSRSWHCHPALSGSRRQNAQCHIEREIVCHELRLKNSRFRPNRQAAPKNRNIAAHCNTTLKVFLLFVMSHQTLQLPHPHSQGDRRNPPAVFYATASCISTYRQLFHLKSRATKSKA